MIVLTRSFWGSKFGWDPDVVGKTLRIDGGLYMRSERPLTDTMAMMRAKGREIDASSTLVERRQRSQR